MPAKDRYHDAVVRALIKAGWVIVREQATIIIEGRQLQVDVFVRDDRDAPAFVEIKSFSRPSVVEDLEMAVGKYMVYRAALDEVGWGQAALYLAVPQMVVETIFRERLGILMVERLDMALIGVNVQREEVAQWRP